jgi:hypothetical protein
MPIVGSGNLDRTWSRSSSGGATFQFPSESPYRHRFPLSANFREDIIFLESISENERKEQERGVLA